MCSALKYFDLQDAERPIKIVAPDEIASEVVYIDDLDVLS